MENRNTNLFSSFEHEGWQKAAGQYDAGFGGVTSQSVEPILKAVGAGNGVRLLDVACGPGYVAFAAARLGCDVVGIDFSSAMIEVAREIALKENSGLEFYEGDAEALNFPASSFEAVVMNFGMLHLAR